MSLPEPQPGLVIRYSYLWAREHDAGRDEGVKDCPCALLLATRDDMDDLKVIVLPVTHARPADPASAVEIPAAAKRRLGLDDDQSWIVVTECNVFAWPGPDLRFKRGAGAESAACGFLPARLFDLVRDRFVANSRKARFVKRD